MFDRYIDSKHRAEATRTMVNLTLLTAVSCRLEHDVRAAMTVLFVESWDISVFSVFGRMLSEMIWTFVCTD